MRKRILAENSTFEKKMIVINVTSSSSKDKIVSKNNSSSFLCFDRVSRFGPQILPVLVSTSSHPCFVCPRPGGANSYIRIFADGSSRVEKRRPGCPLAVRVVTRSRWKRKKEGQGLGIEARSAEKACLLRMRPKNRALKAPRLLETLGATFSIGVWHGKRRDNARRRLPRMSIFSLFHETSPRFRKPFEKRSADLFLFSSLLSSHFSPSIPFFCDSLPPRGETVPCFFV